jgi:hypothetical protein
MAILLVIAAILAGHLRVVGPLPPNLKTDSLPRAGGPKGCSTIRFFGGITLLLPVIGKMLEQ